jgi:hypothetical protein
MKTLSIANEEKDEDLDSLKKNFEMRNRLWTNIIGLEKDREDWMRYYLSQLKTIKIEDRVREYKISGMEMTQSLSANTTDLTLDYFNELVSLMETFTPVITALSSTSMLDRHWKEVFKLINLPYTADSLNVISLGDLINKYSITAYIENINTISAAAIAQEKISKDLEKIEKDWSGIKFEIHPQNQKTKEGLKDFLDNLGQLERNLAPYSGIFHNVTTAQCI